MCALRAHINKSNFGKVLLELKKLSKLFQFPINFFQNWFIIVYPKGTH